MLVKVGASRRRFRRVIVLTAILLLFLVGLFTFAAALWPVGGRAQAETPGDPALFVCASPAHSDAVVPLDAEWRAAFPAVADNLPDRAYLAIGWGDLGFYQETPRWRDLTLRTALRAFAGLGPTTLHVLAVDPPTQASPCARIPVDRAGRAALARFVLATAQNGEDGHPRLIAAPRWGEGFYAARGRYGPLRTCNVWTSEALAAAGRPTAVWSPFSFGVMWPARAQR